MCVCVFSVCSVCVMCVCVFSVCSVCVMCVVCVCLRAHVIVVNIVPVGEARVNLLCALVNFDPAGPYTKFAN